MQYYSAILQHENSITIKAIRDKANGEKIIYQSYYHKDITKIPHSLFLSWLYYCLVQIYAPPKWNCVPFMVCHFDKDFDSEFPLWFIRWWTQFGSAVEIFPAPLEDCFLNFLIRHKTDTHGAKFTPLLQFIKKYKIPWILKWQYAKEDMFSLVVGMLNGGISFPTPIPLLTMSIGTSFPQMLPH